MGAAILTADPIERRQVPVLEIPAGQADQFSPRIPAGRWELADDIVSVVVFLAALAGDWIHGAVLPVDDGDSPLQNSWPAGAPAPQR